jgi:hypothetical protein
VIIGRLKPFQRIGESADDWLTDADPRVCVKRFAGFSPLWCRIVHCDEAYAEGYKTAADTLVRMVPSTSDDRRNLIYPVFFLYRHYIELEIKQIIYLAHLVKRKRFIWPKGHGLRRLWGSAERQLTSFWPIEHRSHLFRARRFIKFINDLDGNGESFRYSSDVKRKKLHLGRLSDIDLDELRDHVYSISDLFKFINRRLSFRAFVDDKTIEKLQAISQQN